MRASRVQTTRRRPSPDLLSSIHPSPRTSLLRPHLSLAYNRASSVLLPSGPPPFGLPGLTSFVSSLSGPFPITLYTFGEGGHVCSSF